MHLEEQTHVVRGKAWHDSTVKSIDIGLAAEHAGFQPGDLVVAAGSASGDNVSLGRILEEISGAGPRHIRYIEGPGSRNFGCLHKTSGGRRDMD